MAHRPATHAAGPHRRASPTRTPFVSILQVLLFDLGRHFAPIRQADQRRIAVKVINHLGDEAMKVFRV